MAVRICSICGYALSEGFCVNDGEGYFCSKECMRAVYADEEYNEMFENGEAYWTSWEDEEDEKPDTLRVGYKEPGKPIEIREISNTVSALQGLVDGYFEVGGTLGRNVIVLCDEEGLLKGKPYNCLGLVGSIVILGVSDTDFRGLTDKEVARILEEEGCYA